ncbi:unnamed protein product [Arctogadus glacialis]
MQTAKGFRRSIHSNPKPPDRLACETDAPRLNSHKSPGSGRGSLPFSGRGSLPCSGRGSLPFSGRGSLPCSGRGSLPCSGRGSLPCSGRGSLPCSGRGSLPFSGRGSLPFSGRGSLPFSGRGSLPFSGRGSLPCSGRGSLPFQTQSCRRPTISSVCRFVWYLEAEATPSHRVLPPDPHLKELKQGNRTKTFAEKFPGVDSRDLLSDPRWDLTQDPRGPQLSLDPQGPPQVVSGPPGAPVGLRGPLF